MTSGQRQERTELSPREADVCAPAGEMDRVVGREAARHQLNRPGVRIVVDPDQAGARGSEAGVMQQREMRESQLEPRAPRAMPAPPFPDPPNAMPPAPEENISVIIRDLTRNGYIVRKRRDVA